MELTKFFKIPTSLFENDPWNDSQTIHLMIHLVLQADKNGHITTHLRKMNRHTRISCHSIRTRLKRLENKQLIMINSSKRSYEIDIVDFEDYKS